MQNTTFRTVTVPAAPAFTLLFKSAATIPLRLLIRNPGSIGTPSLNLAFTSNDAVLGASSASYTLPPGAVDVIILEPGQQLFASATGGVGTASATMSISEAIPLVQRR